METSLVVQLVSAIVTVLAMSAIAERVHPRISGLLAGMPLGSVFVYFFTGHERGGRVPSSPAVPHGLASFTGTLLFVLVYIQVGRRWASLGPIVALSLAMLAFFAISFVLVVTPIHAGNRRSLNDSKRLYLRMVVSPDRLHSHLGAGPTQLRLTGYSQHSRSGLRQCGDCDCQCPRLTLGGHHGRISDDDVTNDRDPHT